MTTITAGDDTYAGRLRLAMEGRDVPIFVSRLARIRSLHTGAELAELHAFATARDDDHEWLSDALKEHTGITVRLTDDDDEDAGRWTLSWNAYAESGGEHRYTLILTEHEDLDLASLVIGDRELFPFEYREEVVGQGLAVWAKVTGTEADVHDLRRTFQTDSEVAVVRRGIDDAPRWMRLGLGEWAERDDRVEFRLVLVERGVDDSDHPELFRILRQNQKAALGFYMNFAEELVDLLVSKEVLSRDEVDEVREIASRRPVRVRNDFWRVVPELDDR